jgi:hypothetical protein
MARREEVQGKRHEIVALAHQHGAHNLRIFGSTARGDDQSTSDVDFLVDMDKQRTLLDYIALKQELESLLGCPVDLAEPANLHPVVRDRILQEAIPL